MAALQRGSMPSAAGPLLLESLHAALNKPLENAGIFRNELKSTTAGIANHEAPETLQDKPVRLAAHRRAPRPRVDNQAAQGVPPDLIREAQSGRLVAAVCRYPECTMPSEGTCTSALRKSRARAGFRPIARDAPRPDFIPEGVDFDQCPA